jgi:hypothetical protein
MRVEELCQSKKRLSGGRAVYEGMRGRSSWRRGLRGSQLLKRPASTVHNGGNAEDSYSLGRSLR